MKEITEKYEAYDTEIQRVTEKRRKSSKRQKSEKKKSRRDQSLKKRSTTHKNPFAEKVIESNIVHKSQTVKQKSISIPTTSEFDDLVRQDGKSTPNPNTQKISIDNISQLIQDVNDPYYSPDEEVNLSDERPGPKDLHLVNTIQSFGDINLMSAKKSRRRTFESPIKY